jgi:methyl-accepting chemotaxis protein
MALAPGDVFVSPLDLNRERGQIETPHKPVIRYGIPVRYLDGEKAGIVITNIYAEGFLSNLGSVMLIDGDGYFLSNPIPAKSWGNKRDLGHGATLKTDFADTAAGILGNSKGGSMTTAEKAITYMKVPVPGSKVEWTLVLDQPMEALLVSVRKFQATFWGILAGSLAVAIVLAFYIDSKITRPIEMLTDRAEKVSMGELLGEVKIDDKGEIGQLADAFERMRVSMVRMIDMVSRKSA